jgi:hypothetical protein
MAAISFGQPWAKARPALQARDRVISKFFMR